MESRLVTIVATDGQCGGVEEVRKETFIEKDNLTDKCTGELEERIGTIIEFVIHG